MIIVIMGVAGVGKSTVGEALAQALDWPFREGDDFHPAANVAKMAAGQPLTDADRAPWLTRLAAEIRAVAQSGGSAVVSCSALKVAYRQQLQAAGAPTAVRFVHLYGAESILAARLAARSGHFMPPGLLRSQLQTLEPPVDALALACTQPVAELVQAIRIWAGV